MLVWIPENDKATCTKPAFNVWPLISMAFRWWIDDGLLIVTFGSSLPHHLKKRSAHGLRICEHRSGLGESAQLTRTIAAQAQTSGGR